MNGTERKMQSEERRQKSDKALQFSEERIQLLDTIREMIDAELDRRAQQSEGNPHPENPPPEHAGCEPPRSKPHRDTFWQRLVSRFTVYL